METDDNSTVSDYLAPLAKGAIAGLVATGPMTLFMLGAHRFLPHWQRSSLPPKKITMNLARRVGLKKHMSKSQRQSATWAAHFAYGTGMGVIYGPLAKKIPLPFLLKGPAFGLAVWVASYLGAIPALAIPAAARDETTHRNVLMIGAHLVWGAVAGLVADLLERG